MKMRKVLDLMIPLSGYATVPKAGTLREAIEALQTVQEYDQSHYRHRAVLVFDEKDRVIGKLGLLDILRSVEDGGAETTDERPFSLQTDVNSPPQSSMWSTKSLDELCRDAAGLRVVDIMHVLTEIEYIEEEASIEEAMHQLVAGNLQSLIVTRGEEITGILKLSDIFAQASHLIRSNGGAGRDSLGVPEIDIGKSAHER